MDHSNDMSQDREWYKNESCFRLPDFQIGEKRFQTPHKNHKSTVNKSVVVDIYISICFKYIKVFRYFSVTPYIRIMYGVKFPDS